MFEDFEFPPLPFIPHKSNEVEETYFLLSWAGELQWFAKQGDRRLGGRLNSIDALRGTIRNAEALGWDLYLNLNPTNPRPGAIKLAREDVRHWRYICVDLDPVSALAPPDFWLPKLDRATRVFSGRGYQCWMAVEGLESKPRAEAIMRGYLRHLNTGIESWAPGWRVDTSCADLARVVRCPGSVNQKSGRRATLDHISRALMPQAEYLDFEEPAALPPETSAASTKLTSFEAVLPYLTVTSRRFFLEGISHPGRHSAAFHATKQLWELGVAEGTAALWVSAGARACRPSDDGIIEDAARNLHRIYSTRAASKGAQ